MDDKIQEINIRIRELLVEQNKLTTEQIPEALEQHKKIQEQLDELRKEWSQLTKARMEKKMEETTQPAEQIKEETPEPQTEPATPEAAVEKTIETKPTIVEAEKSKKGRKRMPDEQKKTRRIPCSKCGKDRIVPIPIYEKVLAKKGNLEGYKCRQCRKVKE